MGYLSRYSILFVILGATSLLAGCGGGGGSDNQGAELVLGDGYDEKAGDVFTTSFTLDATFSNGQSGRNSFTAVKTYSQVSIIPSKYGYSLSKNGPFLLETTDEDGVLDGLEYMTESGRFIIDDDLDYFTSVEYTTESGSEEPENIYIGDKFSFIQNSTLFDSQSGVDAGYEITNIDFSVLREEQVTVPAGSFNAVKIGYSISSTISKNNIVDTVSGTGSGWFDTTNGFMLKLIIEDGNMTLSEQNVTASFSAETILQSYSISQNKPSKISLGTSASKTLSLIDINPLLIFHNLKKSIQKVH
jgi:hypothetical protein